VTGAATFLRRGSGYSSMGSSAIACQMQMPDAESVLSPYFTAV
jgi:hypothetical protein